MEKTYAYATIDGINQLAIGELQINGSVKIHTGTSIYGLSNLRDLNELKKGDRIRVSYYDTVSLEKGYGYLVISYNKPRIITDSNDYVKVENCIVRKSL